MKKNALLFVAVLIISYLVAPYFGDLYNKFYPQHGSWIVSRNDSIFFAGLLLSYITLIPFAFELFGTENKKKWIIWSLLPIILLLLFADASNIYIPILVSVIAFTVAKLINLLISKLYYSNHPPMVTK